MFEAEEYEKIGKVQSESLIALHAGEKRNLTTGVEVPIDKAMSMLARSREGEERWAARRRHHPGAVDRHQPARRLAEASEQADRGRDGRRHGRRRGGRGGRG